MIYTTSLCWILTILLQIQRTLSVDVYHSPQSFCYTDKKCSEWPLKCKTGTRQSPIDLTVPDDQPEDLVHIPMRHFKADHFFMQNNGHTINLDFTPAIGNEVHIFPGYGLTTTKYRFANCHLHWGFNDSSGSEHRIEGKAYAMEMHLVHYNEKYPTLAKAVASGDRNALAVVGVLFDTKGTGQNNPALAPIIKNLKEMQQKHKYWLKVDLPLDLTPLIPSGENEKLYAYQGSLTTPTCNEQVNWYVFQKPVSVTVKDVKAFRSVVDGYDKAMLRNHRPIQKTNGRKIELYELR